MYTGFGNQSEAKTLGITSIYVIVGMAILGLATELADYEIKKMGHLIKKVFSKTRAIPEQTGAKMTSGQSAANRVSPI